MRFLALHRDAKIGETDPLIGLQPVEACVVKPCWLLKKKKNLGPIFTREFFLVTRRLITKYSSFALLLFCHQSLSD